MELNKFKSWFNSLDKKSEEFQKVFETVNDKYFDFDEPDEYLKAVKIVNAIALKGSEEELILVVKIMSQLILMKQKGSKAGSFSLQFKDGEPVWNVDIYTDPTEFHKMKEMIGHTVVAKAKGTLSQ